MPENDIKITISSDVANAVAGINSVTSAANKSVGNLVGMQAAGTALGMSLFTMGENVAQGLKALVTSFAEAGTKLQMLHLKTGISVEMLSSLKVAAELSGTSIDAMAGSFRRMGAVVDAANQGNESAAKKLKGIGLTIDDLRGQNPDQIFEKIAIGVANIEDPARKAAVAVQFFGRTGTNMLPMLSGGAEGLKEFTSQAQKAGLVMSGEDALGAKKLKDAFTTLDLHILGFKQTLSAQLAPAMLGVVTASIKLVDAVKGIATKLLENETALKIMAGLIGFTLVVAIIEAIAWLSAFISASALFNGVGAIVNFVSAATNALYGFGNAIAEAILWLVTYAGTAVASYLTAGAAATASATEQVTALVVTDAAIAVSEVSWLGWVASKIAGAALVVASWVMTAAKALIWAGAQVLAYNAVMVASGATVFTVVADLWAMSIAWVKSMAITAASAAVGITLWASLGLQSTVNAAKAVAAWVVMAGAAVVNAAIIAVSWLLANAGAIGGALAMASTAAIVVGGWAVIAAAAVAGAAVMAVSWLVAAAPIIGVIALIAAIGLAVYLLASKLEEHFGLITMAWDGLVSLFDKGWQGLKFIFNLIADALGSLFEGPIDGLKGHWSSFLSWLTDNVNKAIGMLNKVLPEWLQISKVEEFSMEGLIGKAKELGGMAKDALTSAFKPPEETDAQKKAREKREESLAAGLQAGGGGGAAGKAQTMADVMADIAKANNKAIADAYMAGGIEQSDLVRASQEKMMTAVHAAAAKMSDDLGIKLPDATKMMFDKMNAQETAFAAARQKIAQDNMMAQIDAYMKGGQASVDIVKKQQSDSVAAVAKMQADSLFEIDKMTEGVSVAFKITMPEAALIMNDKMAAQQTKLASVQEQIAHDNMMAQIDVYLTGGQAAVDILKAQQEASAVVVGTMAKDIHKAFAIDMSDAVRVAVTQEERLSAARKKAAADTESLIQALWKATGATGANAAAQADFVRGSANPTGATGSGSYDASPSLGVATIDANRRAAAINAGLPDPGPSAAAKAAADAAAAKVPPPPTPVLPPPPAPEMAGGGIVKARPGGILARLGEGGQDEAIIPLGRGGGSLGGPTINNYSITLSGVITDPVATGQAVADALNRASIITGPLVLSSAVRT